MKIQKDTVILSKADVENPLGYKPVISLLVSFSIPSIISVLVNSVYNMVDQVFIGQGVGHLGNAATTVTFPIMTLLSAIGILVGAGGSAYAALRLGERDSEEAERTLNNMFVISLFAGVVLMVLGLIFVKPLLRLFGATDTIMPYGLEYATVILLGAPSNIVATVLSNLARTDSAPKVSMFGVLVGVVLNTILDPLYIFVFHMGVRGAAIATITSQYITAALLVIHFIKKSKNLFHMRFKIPYMKPDYRLVRASLKLGISSCVTQAVGALMQTIMNSSLRYYGAQSAVGSDAAISAVGVVTKIAVIMAAFGLGIGMGVQPILGFNYGAKKYGRVMEAYKKATVLSVLSIFIFWMICQTFPDTIISIFGNEDAQFTNFAVKALRTVLLFNFLGGIQNVATNYFQSTGQVVKATLLSMLRQLLVLTPLLLVLPMFLGLYGVLYATPTADFVSTFIALAFVIPEMKKLKRLEI